MTPSRPISNAEIAALAKRLREETLPRITADGARQVLASVQGARPRKYKQFVDGREGAALDSVQPGGNIRFLFGTLTPVLQWIFQELRERSPVGPPHIRELGMEPHYKDVHWLFIDGSRDRVPISGEEVIVQFEALFVNARPYARRLEHGWSLQAPDGVYELVALEAERRFPDAAIVFHYLSAGEIPQAIPWRQRPQYRYPAITVRAK